MISKRLYLFLLGWVLLYTSEKTFPKVNRILGTEADWGSLFLFKPFHLMVSIICFVIAFLIFRYIFLICSSEICSRGSWLKKARVMSIILIGLIGWIILSLIIKHPIPSMLIIGVLVAFELFQRFSIVRRNRRLKAALQELKQ